MIKKILKFNNWVAIKSTLTFGSVWIAYLFFAYGFGPILWPKYQSSFLYWSNTVQLWSLPLILVGTNLLGSESERRSKETHDAVMNELDLLKKEQSEIMDICKALHIHITIKENC